MTNTILYENDTHKNILLEASGLSVLAVPANQHLIVHGSAAMLLDPGGHKAYSSALSETFSILGDAELRSIFLSHQDPDIVAAINAWFITTNAEAYISQLWIRFVPHFGTDHLAKQRLKSIPDEGMILDLDDAQLSVLPAHFLNEAGSFQVYDPIAKVLYSGDLGTSLGMDYVYVPDFDHHLQYMEGFHKRYMTSNQVMRSWANMVRELDIETIAPRHGAIFKGKRMVNRFIDWCAKLQCGADIITGVFKVPAGSGVCVDSLGELDTFTMPRPTPSEVALAPIGNSTPNAIRFGVVSELNDSVRDTVCLHHIFEQQVDKTPEALALICREVRLTYQQLDDLANQLARHLRSLGVGPGKLVGIYLERSQRHIIAILAILKSGAGYVPLDPNYPTERMKHIVADAEVRVLVTEQALSGQAFAFFQGTAVLVDSQHEAIAKHGTTRIALRETGLKPADLCYIIYTSGTTGRPKGIMTEHRNAVTFVEAFTEVCRLNTADRVYQGFSLGFDGSVEEIWMAFAAGAALVVATPEVARFGSEVARLLTEEKVTFFSTVPTFLSMIKEDLPTVRLIVVSGEQCPAELVEKWAHPNRRMLNVYGPTETTVNTTAAEVSPHRPVTIGQPLRGYEIYILDSERNPVPAGESGELYIGGPTLARGYLNQPELTAKHFVVNPLDKAGTSPRLYRTGDLVSLGSDGDLRFHGRIDTQVKIRGFRIELSEIESVLREHSMVQAAVVQVFQRNGLEELAAFVVANDCNEPFDRDDLLTVLRKRLPPHMVPGYLDLLDEIPTLPSGKADRKRLPEPKTPLVLTERKIVPPKTELEAKIVSIWEHLFKLSPISTEDDFFLDLGGYSLLAAQMVSLLRNECKLNASIRDIYTYSTISKLAQQLTACGDHSAEANSDQQSETERSSKAVLESMPSITRWCVIGLQAITICLLYGVMSTPLLVALLSILSVTSGRLGLEPAIWIVVAMIFLAYPMLILMSIVLKWLIIGRYQAGEYPVWSLYYFRWWLATRIQNICGISLFSGTPVMSFYYRLMGAKVGKNCIIDTPFCAIHDLVSIGDDSSICAESQLLGYQVRDGMLILGSIEIGDRCFIGTHCAIGLNTKMGNDSRLDDLSLLPDAQVMEAGEARRGSPAQPAEVFLPELTDEQMHRPRHPLLFGLIYLILAGAVGVLFVIAVLPSLAMVAFSLLLGGLAWAAVSLFVALPVGRVWFCFAIAIVKKIILGRLKPGVYSVESTLFLRKWVVDALFNIGRNLLYTMYTTIYLPPWLRMLGAKIGPRAEISTVSQLTPDLIDIGAESFFADGSMIGGRRFFRGYVVLAENRIGCRSFVGNSAMLPVGASLGDNCLLGVLSAPPAEGNNTPDGTEWLGSPSFPLTYRQKVSGFDESSLYRPSKKLYVQRYIIDALRILIPSVIAAVGLIAFIIFTVLSYWYMPVWVLLAFTPIAASSVAIGIALCIVPLKKLLMGRFDPVVKPLWSRYVWWNEVVNGAYESIGAPILSPLMGTPFFCWYLRLLGCKVGKHVFLETALFSEFDLVEIGDYAALNLGVVVQNHLFEDRIMKSSYLKIGNECSVGNMSVILYDTEMQQGAAIGPLSLLMKGETLAPFTRWLGIPTRLVAAQNKPDGHPQPCNVTKRVKTSQAA